MGEIVKSSRTMTVSSEMLGAVASIVICIGLGYTGAGVPLQKTFKVSLVVFVSSVMWLLIVIRPMDEGR